MTHTLSRDYVINMPQMALGGLSESWLFKEIGDAHWEMITSGLDAPSSQLMDTDGDRLYATFTRIRIVSTDPLSSFSENASLQLKGSIARFGAGVFFGDLDLKSDNKLIAATIMSTFTKRGEKSSNTTLLKAQPIIPATCKIESLNTLDEFGSEYRQQRRAPVLEPIFECDYEILPSYDINGVGLIYFAAYPIITDICELRFMNEGNAWAMKYSTISRDICYMANANLNEVLIYRVHSKNLLADNTLEIISSLSRRSDRMLMAYVTTRKTLTSR